MAQIIIVNAESVSQRIDNFIFKYLKGVPKVRVYRAIRQGEVRVNKGRIKPEYRLKLNDQVRVPPLNVDAPKFLKTPRLEVIEALLKRILYEDSGLIVLAKPSGLPVHGGSGIQGGVIELLRLMRTDLPFLELIHRLDRETSGCLLLAKKRQVLLTWHQYLKARQVRKQYLALVKGEWQGDSCRVEAPLIKNVLQSGERMVKVAADGKSAVTLFRPLIRFPEMCLVEARPITGRTHQIRVHLTHIGHPIAGDQKYGDPIFNQQVQKLGLKRLFLHAASISPPTNLEVEQNFGGICALLEPELKDFLNKLSTKPLT